jgi:uncharacterized membrane protein
MNTHQSNGPRLILPIAALLIASITSCLLLLSRNLIAGSWRQLYLPWNLLLAWLPLCFAWLATRENTASARGRWRFRLQALAWLLFFPNAPYILTDLSHLPSNFQGRFWVDLALILLFALTGLVLGFLSLYLMHVVVAKRFGWVRGWLFAAAAAGLGGIGICLGRFLRWNSWDAILNPGELLADLWWCVLKLSETPRLLVVPPLFATLLFVAYVLLHALTRLAAPDKPKLIPCPP